MERIELEQYTKLWLRNKLTVDAYESAVNIYLKQNNYRLYKYQSPFTVKDGPNFKEKVFDRFYNHIKHQTMTISAPSMFNDPFDCQYALPPNCNAKAMEVLKMANDCYNRVGCLAENYDNLLMWSHYGGAHQGVCIEYDMANFSTAEANCFFAPIIYATERVKIPPRLIDPNTPNHPISSNEESMLREALFTKDKIWSYEKEWRIIKRGDYTKEAAGYMNFSMPPIRAIYLGAAISNTVNWKDNKRDCFLERLAELKELCEEKRIRLQMLSLNPATYDLQLGKCITAQ